MKETLKQAEDFFAEPIRKAHEAHRAMIAAKNEITDPLKLAESTAKGAIRTYVMEMERKQREAEEKRRFEQEALLQKLETERAAGSKIAEKILAQVQQLHDESLRIEEKPQMTGTNIRRSWKFRIVDESLIPRKYLIVDEQKIGAVVRQMKEKTSIPGIEAYEDVSIAKSRS